MSKSMKNNLYDINAYDGLVSTETQSTVWEYLRNQTWYIAWRPVTVKERLAKFIPAKSNNWLNHQVTQPSAKLHRCVFADNELDLKLNHRVIWKLWKEINAGLDEKYEITGPPEGMYEGMPLPVLPNGVIEQRGWRVYANGTASKYSNITWGPHRDNPNVDDETSVTIIYCANPEWYPRWGGEFVFFPEDPEGKTGDHQQHNGPGQQQRGFNVGWADQGKIVSPVPNRVIVYDSRSLHNTKAPCNSDAQELQQWRVVFRARLKTT
jgi:hypothetical protein